MSATAAVPAAAEAPWPSPARAWWTVVVLTLAYVVSFVDRQIISLLIEPIKADFGLTDTQLALLQGMAFAIFYAVMGVPLGWLADRISRRGLIAGGVGVWCLATAGCGLAGTFGQLFGARLLVGAGEAALSPAAMSMFGDLFPREKRGLPIGVYAMAAALGAGLALMAGGAVIHAVADAETVTLPVVGALKPWQAAFVIVGLAGLVLLPLLATVPEPPRRATAATAAAGDAGIAAFLWQNRAFYARHYLGITLYAVATYAVLAWVPVYFMRVHGWSAAETGFRYGFLLFVFGGLGTVLGGWIATRLHARRVPAPPLLVVVGSVVGVVPFLVAAGLVADPWVALVLFGAAMLFLTGPGGTAIQAIQDATPGRFRGRASALYYVFSSIVGLSLGPLSVAIFTDYVFGDPKAIGIAISIVSGVLLPAAAWLVIGGKRRYLELAAAN